MSRLLHALALAGATVAASGCSSPPPPEPIAPSAPLAAKSRAGLTFLDVRELPSRPRLTIIGRQGDPQPALVAAIAADQRPELNAALAGLLAGRLQEADVDVRVLSDGAGLRVMHGVGDEGVEPFLEALAIAMASPVRADEPALDLAEAHVDALKRRPLDALALVPLARCAARGADLASSITWRNDAPGLGRLETARREALVRQRTAIAIVGPEALGEDVADALASVDGWPEGTSSPVTWPDDEAHGAFRSQTVAAGRVRLDVAVRVGSAVAASAVARRLAGDAPVHGKLGALREPWRLQSIEATALPHGGCLSLRLTEPTAARSTVDEGGVARAAASAAETVRVLQAEVALELEEPADAFEVTREIIEADAAVDVASRAAWWILSKPVAREPRLATALVASASDASTASPDDEAMTTAYRDAVSRQRSPAAPGRVEREVAIEPGQGQLWLLVGNPCALSHEGIWDGGRAALAAAAAAASSPNPEVTVVPWVGGDGVGILAHGGMLRPDEPAADLARRVADAAGRAYTTVSPAEPSFDLAKQAALVAFGGERSLAWATFAERASPTYPGRLAPWGDPDRLASTGPLDAAARWGDLVRGPARVAVIANHDAAQADAAVARLERWLPPASADGSCAESGTLEPPRPGARLLTGGRDAAATAIVGVAFPAHERGPAALTRVWLLEPDGPLRTKLGSMVRHLDVEVVRGGERAALAVLLQTSDDRMAAVLSTAREVLSSLASEPPSEAAFASATAAYARAEQRDRALAEHRVAHLWSREPVAPPPSRDDHRAWLSRRLDPKKLIVVSEVLDEPTAVR